MTHSNFLDRRPPRIVFAFALVACMLPSSVGFAKGEPAEDFVKRLRAAGYFELAVTYLDRLEQYPGVSPDLLSAIDLEKAQTFIDAAINSRSSKDRDQFFLKAESSLGSFLENKSHPRASEARMQLGKLQMVRATQLLVGEPNEEAKKSARDSYLAAAKTFDAIVEDLKTKLTDMRGQKIDKQKEPEKAKLRDLYQFNYLEAQLNAGDVRKLAAQTYSDPGKEGKELLTAAESSFSNLTKKYSKYAQGAISYLHLGDVYQELGDTKKALDSYLRMLEGPDADALRDAKYLAACGLIKLRLAEEPAKFQEALNRTAGLIKTLRPNEKRTPSVQKLRIALANAYLKKSKDDKQKPTDAKRAESDGRQLLLAASKVPGPHVSEAKEILSSLGIASEETASLPTAEPPKSLQDALEKTGKLLEAEENMKESLKLLEGQPETPALKKEIDSIAAQIDESKVIAIQILRGGLAMTNLNTDRDQLNQARQYLAYYVFQRKNFRDAAVVGEFLARNAPGTELGLRGGLIAMNSLQLLLAEVPETDNDGLLKKLDSLADFLMSTWPDDPKAAAGQTMRVRLLLQKDRFNDARKLILKLEPGPQKASLLRLLGQLLWNQSIKLRRDGKEAEADKVLKEGLADLTAGLDAIGEGLAESESLQAALVLTKMHRKLGDDKKALAVLEHPNYGPLKLVDKLGPPNPNFRGDLYTTELKVLIGVMIQTEGDISQLLTRADETMKNLRDSFVGADGAAKLTSTYRLLAYDVKSELDEAPPAKKAKLINIFRLLLERISQSTKDDATMLWVAQTLVDMGKASMAPNDTKATGEQAISLLKTASETFANLKNTTLTTQFQHASCDRLIGSYQAALDKLEVVLKEKPMMLDAQKEAALAYESWAAELKPAVAAKAYRAALSGGRPDAKGQNVIWGWGKISKLTSGNPKFREQFFEARYHVALTRYRQGKSANDSKTIKQAVKDITMVESLYPELGGDEQRKKFDALLKVIQKAAGEKVTGLKPLK